MGGTTAPLGWTMPYDPIIFGLGAILAIRRPTFVDDLAANVVGPVQAFRTQILLLFLGRVAGLHVDVHTCRWLRICSPPVALLTHIGQLPVEISWVGPDVRVHGLTPAMVLLYLRGTGWTGLQCHHEQHATCRCRLKTAYVVACHRTRWAQALRHAPFASSEVQTAWPYLGVTVAGPTADTTTPQWTPGALTLIRNGTWQRALDKMVHRAQALALCTCSQ